MDDSEKLRNLRVGDQERQSALAALAEHLGAGRLDVDEYAHRVDACLAARTRRESTLRAAWAAMVLSRPAFPPPGSPLQAQEMPEGWVWQWLVQEDGRSGGARK